MTLAIAARPEPMRTGGGGTVVEVLLGLTVAVAAVLAALGWWSAPDADADDDGAGEPLASNDAEGDG